MNKDETRRELVRLVAEAPRIAPSIAKYEQSRTYGSVTDESLDVQASQRWELEAAAVISQLASSGAEVYVGLQAQYARIKDESKRYHSRSILVHQVMQLLTSANELLSSPMGSVEATQTKRAPAKDLELPQKVTFSWLFKHVPVGLWLAAAALLLGAFAAGVRSSELSFIREIFALPKTHPTSSDDAQAKPAKP